MLSNLPIAKKLAIALLLPLLALTALSGYLTLEQFNNSLQMQRIDALARVAPKVTELVDNLQRERGNSAGYIASNAGEQFKERLAVQKPMTDSAMRDLKSALAEFDASHYGTGFQANLDEAVALLEPLGEKRSQVESLSLNVGQMAGYYTGTIDALINIVRQMVVLSSEGSVTNKIASYLAIVQAKERAGLERATGAAGFSKDFSPQLHSKFLALIQAQDTYFEVFHDNADQTMAEFLNRNVLTAQEAEEVAALRKIAIAAGYGGDKGSISGVEWFDTITRKIDKMKGVEEALGTELTEMTGEIVGKATRNAWLMVVLMVIVLMATVTVSWLLARSITRPINSLAKAVGAMSDGDYKAEVTGGERGDEIGLLARSMDVFREGLIKAEKMALEQAELQKKQLERAKKIENLCETFNGNVSQEIEALIQSRTTLEGAAQSMQSVATDTRMRATDASAAGTQVNANVQGVSTAVEELSASIEEICRQVASTSNYTQEAKKEAESTNEVVLQLAEATGKIDDVINLITDIAEQTNLLALNATIEAARAGEAGKGFAVVATEVKNLASQTASATEDISKQIGNVQRISKVAVQSIEKISAQIEEISNRTTVVAASVEEQSAATRDISSNVTQAATGVESVTSNVTIVSEGTDQTLEAGDAVTSTVGVMSQAVDKTQGYIQNFLLEVKEA